MSQDLFQICLASHLDLSSLTETELLQLAFKLLQNVSSEK